MFCCDFLNDFNDPLTVVWCYVTWFLKTAPVCSCQTSSQKGWEMWTTRGNPSPGFSCPGLMMTCSDSLPITVISKVQKSYTKLKGPGYFSVIDFFCQKLIRLASKQILHTKEVAPLIPPFIVLWVSKNESFGD